MKEYHGIIIKVSQKDKSIFEKLKIIGQKKSGSWILYKILVKSKDLEKTIKELQKNMVEKSFYFHLYRNNELIVVFNQKIFKAETKKSAWKEIIEYGKLFGIPEEQLDFYPCRAEDETY